MLLLFLFLICKIAVSYIQLKLSLRSVNLLLTLHPCVRKLVKRESETPYIHDFYSVEMESGLSRARFSARALPLRRVIIIIWRNTRRDRRTSFEETQRHFAAFALRFLRRLHAYNYADESLDLIALPRKTMMQISVTSVTL